MLTTYATLFAAGLLTFASPCVLPLLPVYVATLGGASASAGDDPALARRRLRRAGLGFAVGLTSVFVALGMGASLVAATLAAHRRALLAVGGAVMLLFGLKLVGLLRVRALDSEARPLLDRVPTPGGFLGGVVFGAAFAVGWTPCVGPVLGATLTYAASTASSPWRAGLQLAVYAAGLSLPLVAAAFAAPKVLAFARKLRGSTPIFQRAMGVALVVVSIPMLLGKLELPLPSDPSTSASAPCDEPGAVACAAPTDGVAPAAEALAGKPRLVEFVSRQCTSCARMAPVVDDLVRRCAKDGTLLRVTIDDDHGKALASRYGVRVVPTFVSVDAAGAEVDRLVGEQQKDRLEQALLEVRGAACPAG